MKPFTYAQKKWVMATALLAVLAVNVSFNPQKEIAGSADLAAKAPFKDTFEDHTPMFKEMVDEAVKKQNAGQNKQTAKARDEITVEIQEGENTRPVGEIDVDAQVEKFTVRNRKVKVPTSQGTISVNYIDNGRNEVLAIFPKKNTEGKICTTCGYETVSFKVENIEDVDALNVAVLKKWDKDKTTVAEDASSNISEEKSSEKEKTDVAEEKDLFEKVSETCEKKSAEEDVIDCLKDKYLKILKSKTAKDIEPKEALKFYKEQIQSRLLKQVSDAKRIAARSRRSALSQTSFMTFMDSSDSDKNPEEMMVAVANIITEMIEEVPSKFESVRKSLLVAESDILKHEAAKLKETERQALTTKDPYEYPYLMAETQGLKEELQFMRNEFYFRNQYSLGNAYDNSNISEDAYHQYMKYFVDFNTNLMAGLAGQNKFLEGINLNSSSDLVSRLGAPGRIQGTLGSNPAISSRTGATISNRSVLVPVTNGILIPQTNAGITFSPIADASPENLRMREAIRARLNKN